MFANYLADMNFTRRLFAAILLTAIFTGVYTSSDAQTDQPVGNWNSILIKGKTSPKWALYCEGNIRSNTFDLKYDYFEIKSAMGYAFTKNFTTYLGTGFFNSDEPGGFFQTPALQKEFRTWLELNLKQTFNRFNFEHRVRLEQRFIDCGYRNQLKYRFGIAFPINKAELVRNSIYLAINDELYIRQYGKFVDGKRLYFGTGYKMNDNTALQIGCVNDNDYTPNGHSIKNYMQVLLIYDFANLFKKHA